MDIQLKTINDAQDQQVNCVRRFAEKLLTVQGQPPTQASLVLVTQSTPPLRGLCDVPKERLRSGG